MLFYYFFRPGVVDLPIEGAIANPDTITLPEIFHDLETAVADLKYVIIITITE